MTFDIIFPEAPKVNLSELMRHPNVAYTGLTIAATTGWGTFTKAGLRRSVEVDSYLRGVSRDV
jgi:hypothetical protein